MGTDLLAAMHWAVRGALRTAIGRWFGFMLNFCLQLAAVFCIITIASAQTKDPVLDVGAIKGRLDLSAVRGAIIVDTPKIAVDVIGPQGNPITLSLDSKSKGPKYYWSLYALTNRAAEPRQLIFSVPARSFLGSSLPWLGRSNPSAGTSPLQIQTSQGPTFLQPLSLNGEDAYALSLAPGENVTLAFESETEEFQSYLWEQKAHDSNQRSRNFFHGVLLGISFLVAFACLALYGLRGRRASLAGAAFTFASLLFLASDMGMLNGLYGLLQPPLTARNFGAAFEAAMAVSLVALLARFHKVPNWRTSILDAVMLLGLVNLALSFVYPNLVSDISRVAFVVVAALGLPLLLKARASNEESFVGVVLVWCFIMGWAFFAAFALLSRADPVATSPIIWASLTAVNAVLGLVLFKQAVDGTIVQTVTVTEAAPSTVESNAMTGAGHALWDWYPAENRLEIGPSFIEGLAYPREFALDSTQKFLEHLHPDDAAGFKTLIAEVVSGSSPYLHAYLRLRDAFGSYKPYVLRAQATVDADTRRMHCIGTLTEQPDYYTYEQPFEAEYPQEHDAGLILEREDDDRRIIERRVATPQIDEPQIVEPRLPEPVHQAAEPIDEPEIVELEQRVVEAQKSLEQPVPEEASDLAERSQFMDQLDQVLNAPAHPSYRVLLIGLDRFKVLNEGLGHAAGDHLLQLVAKRLVAALGVGDLACRMSGSQFAIYCAEDPEGGRGWELARLITVNLGRPIKVDGRDIGVTASMGLSQPARAPLSAEDVLAQATSALLVAKSRGLAQVAQYEAGMRDDRPSKLSLEQDLRGAIDRGEIEVQYQPITRLDSFELAGFEALARWRHPQRGLVPPAEFITMAEQSGTIGEIGSFVLGEATRQLGVWQRTLARGRQMFMAVNVSATQLLDDGFIPQVERLIRRETIVPGTLKLEITESVVIKYPERMKLLFAQLKQRQVSLACDDFGTGFSSLSVLRELPFDTLKIDRSFISPNGLDERARHVLETILELAHGLNMTVVTEGIENEETADAMSRIGFDYGQGYYFGMAAPAREVEDLLAVLPKMIEMELLPPMQPLEPYDMPQSLPSIYNVNDAGPPAVKRKKRKKRSRMPDVR
jgi:diguanylate cyclase (GGDEF)-like protein